MMRRLASGTNIDVSACSQNMDKNIAQEEETLQDSRLGTKDGAPATSLRYG
jgi:hypothetical protein